ncbi:hypothetical protein HDU97_000823 [Phlyctochytrium planicorne]|nr:hypothetical protein HDU97_000823 [Phlyctochytrium planicorne]
MAWKLMFLMYRRFDVFTGFFGISSPGIPIVTVREISDTSFKIHWWVPPASHTTSTNAANPPAAPFLGTKLGAPLPDSAPPKSGTDSTDQSASSESDVKKHLIEVNGLIIGESSKDEICVVVTGLNPETQYRIRVWAVSTKRLKSPSGGVLIKTLPAKPAVAENAQTIEASASSKDETIQELDDTHLTPEAIKEKEALLDNEIDTLTVELEQLFRHQHEINVQMQSAEMQFKREEESLREELERLRESRKQGDLVRAEHKTRLKQLEDSKKELDTLKNRYEKEVKASKAEITSRDEKLKVEREELRRLEEETKRMEVAIKQDAETTERKRVELEREAGRQKEQLRKLMNQKSELIKQLDTLRADLMKKRESLASQAASAAEDRARMLRAEDDALSEKILARKLKLDHEQRELLERLRSLQDEHQSLQVELREESRAKVQILEDLNRERRESSQRGLLPSLLLHGSAGYSQLLHQQQLYNSMLLSSNDLVSLSGSSTGLGGLVSGSGTQSSPSSSSMGSMSVLSSAPPPGLPVSFETLERNMGGLGGGFGSQSSFSMGSGGVGSQGLPWSVLGHPETSPNRLMPRASSMEMAGTGPNPMGLSQAQRSYGPISSPRSNNVTLSSNPSGTSQQLVSASNSVSAHAASPTNQNNLFKNPSDGFPRGAGRTIESPMDLVGHYDTKGLIGLGGLFPNGF